MSLYQALKITELKQIKKRVEERIIFTANIYLNVMNCPELMS